MGTSRLTTTPTSPFPSTGLSCPLLCWNLSGNKGKKSADTISGDVGLQMSLFISITKLLLTSKALSRVSKAFPGYVNSILLCYLFLSSLLSSPAPRVSVCFCLFFLPRHHTGHISLCYHSALHFCSRRKNYEPGKCPCSVRQYLSCRPPLHPRWRQFFMHG